MQGKKQQQWRSIGETLHKLAEKTSYTQNTKHKTQKQAPKVRKMYDVVRFVKVQLKCYVNGTLVFIPQQSFTIFSSLYG